MKKWLIGLIGCLSFFCHGAGGEVAPSGEVIEALFISQNKLKEVLEHIQSLKKELTECSVASEKMVLLKGKRRKGALSLQEYHCQLKHVIFPGLIQELEALAIPIAAGIDELAKDTPVTRQTVKRVVSRAFLLKDRVEIEQQLITLVFNIDAKEREIEQKRNARSAPGILQKLTQEVAHDKHKLPKLRSSFAALNNQIYEDTPLAKERIYLENLQCYLGC